MEADAAPADSAGFGGDPGADQPALPEPVARLAGTATVALLAGLALMGLAFLTNPIPDPSFPWATLPESLRLGYVQPRIEHWPVSYTVGLWTVVFALPLVVLDAYRRLGGRFSLHPSTWLAALPVTLMLGLTTYCRFLWPKLQPPTWNAPSYTLVCWGYCATYDPMWSDLAYAVAFLGVGAAYLAHRDSPRAKHALAAFGLLAFPLGVTALLDAYRRHAT